MLCGTSYLHGGERPEVLVVVELEPDGRGRLGRRRGLEGEHGLALIITDTTPWPRRSMNEPASVHFTMT